MARRYIPQPGDRFKVFVLSRIERPTDYEGRQLQIQPKYYGWPAINGDECLCLRISGNTLITKDREFDIAEFFFVKKAPEGAK
jgi:hypothetical protein